jgi:O-antigen biosynthesis protein
VPRAPARDEPAAEAVWLAPGVLLVAAAFVAGSEDPTIGALGDGDEPQGLEARVLSLTGAERERASHACTMVIATSAPSGDGNPERIVLRDGSGAALELAPEDGASDLKALARRRLAPLDPEARNSATQFLAAAAAFAPAEGETLARSLHALRQAIRERLPLQESARTEPRAAYLESVLRVSARGFYVRGWLRSETAPVARLTLVSPEGERIELLERIFEEPRPDLVTFFAERQRDPVVQHGFVCFFETSAPSVLPDGWVLEMVDREGKGVEVRGPTVAERLEDVRDRILNDVMHEWPPNDELLSEHVHPAIEAIQTTVQRGARVASVVQHGEEPSAPDVSIIVPIYQRVDHLELQLAEFADDAEVGAADLIYVLDSPEDEQALRHISAHLFPIYRVPFRIAIMERNAGFAFANAAGASLARGRLLLFLNSDVLPARRGWLGRLRAFYDSKPKIGALGPKLLYEDNSIQHAGMYYYRPPGSPCWQDAHFYKGLYKTFPDANVARRAPVVSGACLMVARELWERVPWRGIYVRGDYEDNDLCLRLLDAGYENWYSPDAELYHLEAQSYSGPSRLSANRYNMWLHNHLWGDRIETLMEQPELFAVEPAPVAGRR